MNYKFFNYSEATIDVKSVFHGNTGSNVYLTKGDIFGPVEDYQVKISSLALEFDLNNLQREVQFTIYDANTLPYYFEYIDRETDVNNNSLNLQGRGILSGELIFDIKSTTFLISNRYILRPLDFKEFQWNAMPISLLEDNFVAKITSTASSFNVTGSIYAQAGFPRFTEVQLVSLYGVPITTTRNYWLQ